jgi:predicted Fe-S protein YdhL (DUF1289 family)
MPEEPESPCVSICVLDDQDICQGCYRSAEEITDWFMSSVGEKREILDLAQERRNASSTIWLK